MLSYTPNKIRKNAWMVFGFISSIAVIFYVFSLFSIGLVWLNQLFLVVALTADLLFLMRYILYDYVYTINEHGFFSVRRIYGKNNRLLVDLQISRGDVIVKYDSDTDLSRFGRISRKENYCSSAFPLEKYIYIFNSGDKKQAIIIECGADTAEVIANAIEIFGKETEDDDDE